MNIQFVTLDGNSCNKFNFCVEHQQKPTISAENRVQNAIVGSSVQLRCRLSDYSTVRPTIKWLRDRQTLPLNAFVQDEVLQLVNVQVSEAGRYICEVSNEYGVARDYINLIVNRKYSC